MVNEKKRELVKINKKYQKMKTYHFVNFADPVDHKVKIKESEKEIST